MSGEHQKEELNKLKQKLKSIKIPNSEKRENKAEHKAEKVET